MFWRQINLRLALICQSHVCFDEELAAGESAALKEPGFGTLGAGNSDPYVTLRLGERAPTGGDCGEIAANRNLRGTAGVKRGKSGIADLAVTIALPNDISALPGLGIEPFHR